MATFEEKARFVAAQFDEWEVPMTAADFSEDRKGAAVRLGIYELIEKLYKELIFTPVRQGESYNGWVARVAANGYERYMMRFEKPRLTKEERKELRERKQRRIKEHNKKLRGEI